MKYKSRYKHAPCDLCGTHGVWTCPLCNTKQFDYTYFEEDGDLCCENCNKEFEILKVGWFKLTLTELDPNKYECLVIEP